MSAAPAGVAPISVPFILRGHDQVEMVVSFDADSQMNVTLGIPATRWITPEVIKQMEAALIEKRAGPQPTSNRKQKTEKTLVLDSSNQESGLSGQGNEDCVSEYLEDYRLIDDDAKDPKHLRSH